MGCIYLLYDDNGRCYVGKTVDIHNRLNLHKSKYNNTRSRYLNKDYKCDVIVECDDEDELAKLEQSYFDYYKDLCGDKCVNYLRPLQTRKEQRKVYYEKNKEAIAEQNKKWRETHREKTLEYKKQYYEKNKEQHNKVSKEYYETHKEELKEYRETNKEQYIKFHKEYYETNKEKILQQKKQKITCECGSVVQYSEKARHAKSIKHKNYIKHLPT